MDSASATPCGPPHVRTFTEFAESGASNGAIEVPCTTRRVLACDILHGVCETVAKRVDSEAETGSVVRHGVRLASSPVRDAKAMAKDLWHEMVDDRVGNGAAALAFYMVLALFPGAIFALSLLPYLHVPHLQQAVTDLIRQTLPSSAAGVIVKSVSASGHPGLLSVALIFALWSASSGIAGIMQELNIVFDVREQRSFLQIRLRAAGLALSFFALLAGSLVLAVFGGQLQSYIGDRFGWSQTLLALFATLRWLVVLSALHCSFSFIYRFGPCLTRRPAFFTPGSVVATVGLWCASVAFKTYVAHFSSFDVLYGGLGAVVVLLIWLFLAGWVILFGGEINAVLLRKSGAEAANSTRAKHAPAPPK